MYLFQIPAHPGGHILNPDVPWMMVLTPAFTILTSLISFILVYLFFQKTGTVVAQLFSLLLFERNDVESIIYT